jgi:hypothetical protein
MPVIVVTRLRLRDPALLDELFTDAVAAIERAMKSDGNLAADALAGADSAWRSAGAWQERRLPRQRAAPGHLRPAGPTGSRPAPGLPDWQTSWRHLTADGKVAELTHPSPANQNRYFPQPVEPPSSVS